ncbi:pentalenic acid synthase [Streptomyces olivoverticillatus]|uniref:Pentalenic acid synthase n=1 Tax=Streptomyces olivoverticillatus TaxID=66427 RepID=A0A7W7LK27_9ACTN|nr:pentalenic acid synthase [Streptomyces olivoverticillatus]
MTATGAKATAPSAPAFPQDRTCPYQPPADYPGLAAHGPLTRVTLYDGRQVWAVTGHAEARALLVDPRFSSDRAHPGFPVVMPRAENQSDVEIPLIGVDDPRHSRQRRMLIPHFGTKRIAAMRPQIQRIVDGLIDTMLAKGNEAELVSAYALPVPSMVICALLGVPYGDHEFFESRSRALLAAPTAEEAAEARVELQDYLHRLIDTRQGESGGGLEGILGELVSERLAEGELDRDELVMMALVLLIAGHETTSNMIALGTFTLLEHPDQLEALRAEPALMPGAVEELLRYLSIADGLVRVATEDVEIAGRTIRAGEGVLLATSVINRDAGAYERPDALDVRRSARHHVAFGYGVHQCLGQNLARTEMEIALGTLITRIPTLRLAVAPDEIPVKPADTLQGIYALPVAW